MVPRKFGCREASFSPLHAAETESRVFFTFAAGSIVINSRGLKNRAGGFTLLELMIVGVIVAVLAAIALPSYSDYVRRGQIQDGTSALSDGAVKFEQCYQDASPHSYAGCACPATTQYFTYTCAPATAVLFTITANGIAGSSLAGFQYTIDQGGNRTSTTPWKSGKQLCWILRKGDAC